MSNPDGRATGPQAAGAGLSTRDSAVARRLAALIGKVCDVPPPTLVGKARLRGYGLDSVRTTELVLLIEDEFRVQLRLEDLADVHTFDDLIGCVTEALRVPSTREGEPGAP